MNRTPPAAGRPVTAPEVRLLHRAAWRLGLQIAGSCAVIVLVLSGLALFIVLRSQQATASGLLHQAALTADDVGDPPADTWLVIQRPSRTCVTSGLPAGLPDQASLRRVAATGTAEDEQIQLRSGSYRVYTVRRDGETVQAVLDLRNDDRERTRLVVAMLASGSVGLVLSAVAGVWFGRRAVRPLAGALALQRRFIADASHELRTPLTLLTTRAQMHRRHLRHGADPAELVEEADGVVEDASQLTGIVEDLLLASDQRPGTLTERIDLVRLAAQAADAAIPAAAEQDITITTGSTEAAITVRGTRGGLRRALISLLDNAVRHARSTVRLTISRRGGTAIVDVTDDGAGIDPAILPHVFERFASTENPSAPPGRTGRRRYGIGLALVSEIAHRHGGLVSAHNGPDGGAVLRLTLPVDTSPVDTSPVDTSPER